MNILFFAYWGANEGLSQATVIPHLKILSEMDTVDSITYVSIERTPKEGFHVPTHAKITHVPFYSKFNHRVLTKLYDFVALPLLLKRLVKQKNISLLMCRSALAGGIGYWVHRWTGVPFTVESFEPHADYMAELGIWSKSSLSYRLQKNLEEKQKQHALHLMPVTQAHKNKLIEEGVPTNKVSVMPCAVDIDKFAFSETDRQTIRQQLEIGVNVTVGIYVGKFGDIYWDREAFALFKSALEYFEDFHLLLLSPHSKKFVQERCLQFEIPQNRMHHTLVSHDKVPSHLSAADLAFSLHQPSKFSYAFSPIKNGEYWANGLPIVSPGGIGDDSKIIQFQNGGVIAESSTSVDWSKLKHLMVPTRSQHIVELSEKYRNLQTVKTVYQSLKPIHAFDNK